MDIEKPLSVELREILDSGDCGLYLVGLPGRAANLEIKITELQSRLQAAQRDINIAKNNYLAAKERAEFLDHKNDFLNQEVSECNSALVKLQQRIEDSQKQEPFGYYYDGQILCDDGDFKDYFDGEQYDKNSMQKLYAAHIVPPVAENHFAQDRNMVVEWVEIDNAEDAPSDENLVLWDGCDLSVDYVESEVEFGTSFFANGTEATHYLKGIVLPKVNHE